MKQPIGIAVVLSALAAAGPLLAQPPATAVGGALDKPAEARVASPPPAASVTPGAGGTIAEGLPEHARPPADSQDRRRALAAGYNEFGANAYASAAVFAFNNNQPLPDVEKYKATARLEEYLSGRDAGPLANLGPRGASLDDVSFSADVTEKGGGVTHVAGISAMGIMMQLFGGNSDTANVGSFIPAADGQMRGRIIVSLPDGNIYDTGEIVLRPNTPTTVQVPGGGGMTITAAFKDYDRMVRIYQDPASWAPNIHMPPIH